MKLLREFFIAVRFGFVGIIATAVHILVVWFLLQRTEIAPILANVVAFFTALGISFAGNYLWTFRSPTHPGPALLRFFIVAIGVLAINTAMLSLLIGSGWFSNLFSAVFSALLVPAISYTANRFWVFRR